MADASATDRRPVRVLVRVRPPSSAEEAAFQCCTVLDHATVRLDNETSVTDASFYAALGPDADQGDVCKHVQQVWSSERYLLSGSAVTWVANNLNLTLFLQVVDDAWKGINSSILAYGQTGSGKTYTMQGIIATWRSGTQVVPAQYGLIPRIAERLLAQQAMSNDHVVLRCSYCEVYNEQVYDLFATRSNFKQARPRLSVFEGSDGAAHVRNLQHEPFSRMEDLMQLLTFGAQQRSVRQTALNHKSSRGHTLLQLHVEIKADDEDIDARKASIVFADLAGSEPHPGGPIVPNSHAAETRCISISLSALVSVVSALAAGNRHVPYRDSKLTCLMKHALGGNCQTYVIATVSPSVSTRLETQATLQFAHRASAIVNSVVRNKSQDLKGVLQSKNEEISRLKAALQQFDSKLLKKAPGPSVDHSHPSPDSQYKALKQRVVALKLALETERMRVRQLEARNARMAAPVNDNEWELDTTPQQRPHSAARPQTLPKGRPYSARLAAAPDRTGESTPEYRMYQSMSAPTSNAVAPGLLQKQEQRGTSHLAKQSQVIGTARVASCYRSASLSSDHIPPARRKMMAAGRTVRQLGQQMIRDHYARLQVPKLAQAAQNPVKDDYSDAGVAALMEQYSSLFKELGIQQRIAAGADASTPLVTETARLKRRGTMPPRKLSDHVGLAEAKWTGPWKAGQLAQPCSRYGLSGILAAASKVQQRQPHGSASPALSTPATCHRSQYGLSTVLQGSRRSVDQASPITAHNGLKLSHNTWHKLLDL